MMSTSGGHGKTDVVREIEDIQYIRSKCGQGGQKAIFFAGIIYGSSPTLQARWVVPFFIRGHSKLTKVMTIPTACAQK